MGERYVAESFRGRWFVTDTETSTIMTDVATGEAVARATAADMNREAGRKALEMDENEPPTAGYGYTQDL